MPRPIRRRMTHHELNRLRRDNAWLGDQVRELNAAVFGTRPPLLLRFFFALRRQLRWWWGRR